MKTISEIYSEYKIKKNLQEHMFRVAAAAWMIYDSFDVEIDKNLLIQGALFHDMGNIIKFDLTHFPEFNEPEGLEYWQKVKDDYVKKYGKDEHHATYLIMKEIGLNEELVDIVHKMNFSLLCEHRDSARWELKILHHVDMRVGPFGIMTYEDRMNDVKKRYAKVPDDEFNKIAKDVREVLLSCGKDIEKQIFSHCNIEPEDINDESIKPYMEKLKDFVIK